MLKEFKEFAVKGNMIDMAIGIIIGTVFGSIVKSLVSDIFMPPIGLILGNIDFSNFFIVLSDPHGAGPYATLADAQKGQAVTMNIGLFINNTISFIITAFALFILVKNINRLKKEEVKIDSSPNDKECSYCKSRIHIEARKCPNCTSEL
jgi:large conductance mechanosensitive channel